ncbi:hypothetical protein BGW39_005490 [Mortierella sp. 14UC]|nr:hypothetical protein BGW39_005490 [Mortierella sp. 14UC]
MPDPTIQTNAPLLSPPLSPDEDRTTKPIKSVQKSEFVFNNRRQGEPWTPPTTPQSSGSEVSDDPLSRQTTPESDDDNEATVSDGSVPDSKSLSPGNKVDPIDKPIEAPVQDSTRLDIQSVAHDASTEITPSDGTTLIHDDPTSKTTLAAAVDAVDPGTSTATTSDTTNTVSEDVEDVPKIVTNDSITPIATVPVTDEDAPAESSSVASVTVAAEDSVQTVKIAAITEPHPRASVETTSSIDAAAATTTPVSGSSQVVVTIETAATATAATETASVVAASTDTSPTVSDEAAPIVSTVAPSSQENDALLITAAIESLSLEEHAIPVITLTTSLNDAINKLNCLRGAEKEAATKTLKALKIIRDQHFHGIIESTLTSLGPHPASTFIVDEGEPQSCRSGACSKIVSPRARFVSEFYHLGVSSRVNTANVNTNANDNTTFPRCSLCLDGFFSVLENKPSAMAGTTASLTAQHENDPKLLKALASVPICKFPGCARFADWSQLTVEVLKEGSKKHHCIWPNTCQVHLEKFETWNPLADKVDPRFHLCRSLGCTRIILTKNPQIRHCRSHGGGEFLFMNEHIALLSTADLQGMLGDTHIYKTNAVKKLVKRYLKKLFERKYAGNAALELLRQAKELWGDAIATPRINAGFLYTFDYTRDITAHQDELFNILIKIGYTVGGLVRFEAYRACDIRDKPETPNESPTPLFTFPKQEYPHARRPGTAIAGCIKLFEDIIHFLHNKADNEFYKCSRTECKLVRGHKEVFKYIKGGSTYEDARKDVLNRIQEDMMRWEPFFSRLGSDVGASCLYYALQKTSSGR